LDEICSVHPPLYTLKIWGGGLLPAELGGRVCVFFFVCRFVCPSRYDAGHRKPIRIELGGKGHKPPGQKPPSPGQKPSRTKIPPAKIPPGEKVPPEKSPPGQKSPGQKSPRGKSTPGKRPPGQKPPGKALPDPNPPAKSPPGQKTPGEKVPSGDIFYCSSSRQLNHSSFICFLLFCCE